jgi:hypothetical protein
MKRIALKILAGITLLGVAAAAAAGTDALVTQKDPHGVVRVDVEKRAQHIHPVKVVEINGDLISTDEKVALWLKPGKHTLTVRGMIDRDQTFGISRSVGQGNEKNSVEVNVEEGKVYYVGAKVNPREGGRWEPVVWKVEDARAS